MDDDLTVQVRDVERHFGNLQVLRGVDLDAHAGELVALFDRPAAVKPRWST